MNENGEALEFPLQDCPAEPGPPGDDTAVAEILSLHSLGRFTQLEVEVRIGDDHSIDSDHHLATYGPAESARQSCAQPVNVDWRPMLEVGHLDPSAGGGYVGGVH